MKTTTPLLSFSPTGIHCKDGGFSIDPWQPCDRAVITHAHSDHARPGCRHYLAHKDSEPILRQRLGEDISLQTLEYGETVTMNGVKISLHPAGHIIGSAQVRVEKNGEVWVASGDYKLEDDGFAPAFEPVKCHVFITESTFGLPVYKWRRQDLVFSDINQWWHTNRMQGKASVLMGYALGKMQRILVGLGEFQGRVFGHGAIIAVNERLRGYGFKLPKIEPVSAANSKVDFQTALILATSSAMGTPWMNRFGPYSTGYCSGWMNLRGAKNRMAIDRGFVLSDHADWPGLNLAVASTGAEEVYVTHGYTEVFSRWLNEKGIKASEVKTSYGQEAELPDFPEEKKDETI